MTEQTFRAHMSNSFGQWHVYVVLRGRSAMAWPEYDWGDRAVVPTVAERRDALAALGYEVVPGGEWEWTESGTVDTDPTEPVILLAVVSVRPVGGAA